KPRYDLLGVRGCQVEPGHWVSRIEVNGLLELVDSLFVLGLLVGFHTFVELIASLQALTAGRRSHQKGCGCGQHQETCDSVHSVCLLLQLAGSLKPRTQALPRAIVLLLRPGARVPECIRL